MMQRGKNVFKLFARENLRSFYSIVLFGPLEWCSSRGSSESHCPLSLNVSFDRVLISFRDPPPNMFSLPSDSTIPLLLIAAGSGLGTWF